MTNEEIEQKAVEYWGSSELARYVKAERVSAAPTAFALLTTSMRELVAQAYEEAAKTICPYCANDESAEWRDDCGRWHPQVRWMDGTDMLCEATQIHLLKDSLVVEHIEI